MPQLDLREYKGNLRQIYKERRVQLDPEVKQRMDIEIKRRLLNTNQYKACDTIMIYVSTAIEVDTIGVIEQAFRDKKRVAVPRCIKGKREMQFHYIQSLSELSKGSFSVLEPDESLPVVTDFKSTFMIVPALAIDSFGYRLGYGGGYYDRFLSSYDEETAGICYTDSYRYKINHGRYDCKVGLIITEKFMRYPSKYTGHGKK